MPIAADRASAVAELTVVVPTFNERDNVALLVQRLDAALAGRAWEVLFVDDDSPDGTADRVRALARQDPRVRCLQRIGRRGLASACIEGMLASSAPFVAVIDADLQHDERVLGSMLDALRRAECEIVVGSRHVAGGGLGDWDRRRVAISGLATRISRLIIKADLKDPMSGFFMLKRELLEETVRQLSAQGFKILLDIFASARRPIRFKELPYEFGQRLHGASKLDSLVAWEYLMLILDKLIGHIVPVRFVLFAMVGGLGLVVHLAILWTGLSLGVAFAPAQATATLVAMAGNYTLNNVLTYRDQRLTGFRFLIGFISFALVCGVGAIANVGIASYIFGANTAWWLAGIAGAMVGAVWNYAVSSVFTWRGKKPA